MKKQLIQFSGVISGLVFAIFMYLQNYIIVLRQYSLADILIFLGILLVVSLFGAIYLLMKKNTRIWPLMVYVNALFTGWWAMMIWGHIALSTIEQ